MPLLKRLFGQGKSKASNSLTALLIGDFSRVSSTCDIHQVEYTSLLAHEGSGEESPSTSQMLSKSSTLGGHQTSRKALRQLFQHFGAGASSKEPTPQVEAESQRHLTQFVKQLTGYSDVSFVTAADDGQISREKVLSKLTKLFKQSTAPVVFVAYCGPSDERGNWRLSTQAPTASGGSGGGGSGFGSGGGSGGCGGTVLSFREISTLWQRHRKHSQRLVLLLDCANSGYWVASLRMLSKAEQLELSLGVQASDCIHPMVLNRQLTYLPGVFTQLYLANNKWRRDGRRTTQLFAQQGADPDQHGQAEGATTATQADRPPHTDAPQQQQQAQAAQAAQAGASHGGAHRVEQWLPGMMPSYYSTWLSDNLVDYGIALRFFNSQVAPSQGSVSSSSMDPSARLRAADAHADAAAAGAAPGDARSAAPGASSGWRTSTTLLATAEGALGRPSKEGDEVMAPPSLPWGQAPRRNDSLHRSAEVVEESEGASGPHTAAHRAAMRAALAQRATSLQDAARRRYSALVDFHAATSDGVASAEVDAGGGALPSNSSLQRIQTRTSPRFGYTSTPQAEWPAGRSPLCSPGQLPGVGSAPSEPVMQLSISAYGNPSKMATTGPAVPVVSPGPDSGAGAAGAAHPPSAFERRPEADAGGTAVHPWDVEDPDSGHVVGGGEELEVQPSARSDTVAMTWDRRSVRAERGLLEVEERGLAAATSFTNGPEGHHGFVNQLFGALHEVATERRLRARRAPLEGDESNDAMMQDADLDRRASNASLPSFMLPRDPPPPGAGSGATSGTVPLPGTAAVATATVSGARGDASGAGAVMALLTPRTSILGGGPSELPSARQSLATPRQLSRLFLMSVAEAASGAGCALESTASVGDDEMEEEGQDAGLDLAAASQPQVPALLQKLQAQRRQQQPSLHGYAAAEGASALGSRTVSGNLVDTSLSGAAPAPAVNSPQLCASPALSPAASAPDRRRGCRASGAANTSASSWLGHSGGGGGASTSMLRSLLKQQVSIVDSMDLDAAAGASPPPWQRRPGRLEVAGSESSSFLFGDDTERFEMLRLLREQGGGAGGDDDADSPEASAGAEEGGEADAGEQPGPGDDDDMGSQGWQDPAERSVDGGGGGSPSHLLLTQCGDGGHGGGDRGAPSPRRVTEPAQGPVWGGVDAGARVLSDGTRAAISDRELASADRGGVEGVEGAAAGGVDHVGEEGIQLHVL